MVLNLDTLENISEITQNFPNVMLEKAEEDHLARWCEKLRSIQQGRIGTQQEETMDG
jgi:adenylate kinase